MIEKQKADCVFLFLCLVVLFVCLFVVTTRFAARFLLSNFMSDAERMNESLLSNNLSLLRRVLFSRSLRLLPLIHQIGVVEGLAIIVKLYPGILPLSDQHFLAFLSELLKMLSVADGEMTDATLQDHAVDKDGYTTTSAERDRSQFPSHSFSLFFRRECVMNVHNTKIVIPGELAPGVQLRVSAIVLLHSVICKYNNQFFDAEWIGKVTCKKKYGWRLVEVIF